MQILFTVYQNYKGNKIIKEIIRKMLNDEVLRSMQSCFVCDVMGFGGRFGAVHSVVVC